MNESKPWRTFFNGHAPEYDDNIFTKATEAEIAFLLENLDLAPGAAILDVGCGTGRHAVELGKRGFRVTGLDLSEGMLAQAREKAERAGVVVEWIHGDATSFSLGARFDAAICLCEGSIGLLNPGDDAVEQPLAILRNIAAALKPGGRLVVTVLNALRPARLHQPADGLFDPLTMSELSEITANEPDPAKQLRERSFVPTELRLIFRVAGLEIKWMGGGTAGNWRKGALEFDEYEIMVIARRP